MSIHSPLSHPFYFNKFFITIIIVDFHSLNKNKELPWYLSRTFLVCILSPHPKLNLFTVYWYNHYQFQHSLQLLESCNLFISLETSPDYQCIFQLFGINFVTQNPHSRCFTPLLGYLAPLLKYLQKNTTFDDHISNSYCYYYPTIAMKL